MSSDTTPPRPRLKRDPEGDQLRRIAELLERIDERTVRIEERSIRTESRVMRILQAHGLDGNGQPLDR